MYADISRDGFDPARNDQRIVVAQRNLVTDADWNEQFAIEAGRLTDLARDLRGQHWGPKAGGFRVESTKDKAGKAVGHHLTSGRYYVDGYPCVNLGKLLPLADQPNDPGSLDPLQGAFPKLVYLKVWTRHVTAYEAAETDPKHQTPTTSDPALARFDATSRIRTVWQVRSVVLDHDTDFEKFIVPDGTNPKATIGSGESAAFKKVMVVEKVIPADDARGLMEACAPSARPKSDTASCLDGAGGGYTGDANTVFRVEVHSSAKEKKLFKWARDNASSYFPIRTVAKDGELGPDPTWTFALDSLGRDMRSALKAGDWVELVDDKSTLSAVDHEAPLPLFVVREIDPHAVTATIGLPPGPSDLPLPTVLMTDLRRPYLRRWGSGLKVVTGGWQDLAEGILVRFSRPDVDRLRRGDTWLIPARPAVAGILWPRDGIPVPPLNALPSYAPLALLLKDKPPIDLRRIFDPDAAEPARQ